MWNPISDDAVMADFWPPKPSGFWRKVLSPMRKFFLKSFYGIAEVNLQGTENLAPIRPGDGVLLAPNHSHDSDPHVMMAVGKKLRRQLYFMAAWQIFKAHKGIDGFILQRMGAFSVDREGCDRRAIRQAIDLMSSGRWLVIFPEGEVYHTNDRLTPLREGVAFMACTGQKDLEKEAGGKKIWIIPTAIRYKYLEDVTPKLHAAMDKLEDRVKLRSTSGQLLEKRILRFGEIMLTLKEKEQTGRITDGDLAGRLKGLVQCILDRHEAKWLKKSLADRSVSERVKSLRQHLLEIWAARNVDGDKPAHARGANAGKSAALASGEPADPQQREAARAALEDVQLVMQLYSYPGDYVLENPCIERMAETIEKLEEDVFGGLVRPKGKRSAKVILGQPIDVSEALARHRPRQAATLLTAQLEMRIRSLMLGGESFNSHQSTMSLK